MKGEAMRTDLTFWECWICDRNTLGASLSERGLCPECEDVTPRTITQESHDEELS